MIRNLVQEYHLRIDDLIAPLFVCSGKGIADEVDAMPGVKRFSLDCLDSALEELDHLGVHTLILFGLPDYKDAIGSDSLSDDGIIQRALRYIKRLYPHFYLITDVCLCEYTDHGHCGVLKGQEVCNDQTLTNLALQTVSYARAGADMVAPSGMMDGVVATLRTALDEAGFSTLPIMSYAVKYASAFYGPFREAVDVKLNFGDRKTYQMNPANRREAIIEAKHDIEEGADVLMVKPALAYLDIVRDLKEHTNHPIACYNVSGEYAMIKGAAKQGWIDEHQVLMESLLSMKRAGADMIVTYFAKTVAQLLKG